MSLCPTCNTPAPAGATHCPGDGTPLLPRDAAAAPATRLERGAAGPPRTADPSPAPAAGASSPGGDPPAGDPPADPFIGCVIDNRYRIAGLLGSGGIGAVYLGEHVQIHKTVAIKVLRGPLARTPEFRQRFEHEARAASRLSHAGCVSVIDFGCVAQVVPARADVLDTLYLVMEYVRGETLADRLARAPMAPTEAVTIVRSVLTALRHAHSLGLVHRDIKPHNIMLCPSDETATLTKLLDFGLAKLIAGEEPAPDQPVTRVGMVFGTPAYVSPEQAMGNALDARSDLYSLGVVLYEMVCGKTPFHGRDPEAMMRAHIVVPPPPPHELAPHLSPALATLILKALAKELDERPASAEEFQTLLAACPEAGGSPGAGPTPVLSSMHTAVAKVTAGWRSVKQYQPLAIAKAQAGWRWAVRHKPLAAAAGAAVLLLLGTGLILLLRSPAAGPPRATPTSIARAPLEPPPDDDQGGMNRAEYALLLVERNRPDRAIDVARAELRKDSHDGMARFALGVAYQSKLWCSDAIDEFEKAVRDLPALRSDLRLIHRVITCFKGGAQSRAVHFLAKEVGRPAIMPLRQALRHPDPDVRRGAKRALDKM